MRVAAGCSSSTLTATDLPECVRFSVPAFLSIPAAEWFALFVDAPNASSGMGAVVNGVLFLQIQVVEGSQHHTATIHAIGVRQAEQNKGVAVSSTKSIHALLHDVPGCAGILIAAMSRLGHGDLSLEDLTQMVKHVHMLLLDSTSQVDFGWHEDTYDLDIHSGVRETMLSIIVQLSATFTTAMQLHGFAYHEYGGQASGIIFHGRALHRSVPRIRVPPHHSVWKVAFFVDARRLHVGKG